jgi:hypothetical protein
MATMNFTPTTIDEYASHITNLDVNDTASYSYDDLTYINTSLPTVPEGAHFGDNLRCATINSQGSGECYAKVEIIVDFAVDELLDIIIVTELKTTLARTRNTSIQHQGFYS